MLEEALQPSEGRLVRGEAPHGLLPVKDAQQVPAQVGGGGPGPEGGGHGLGHRDGGEGVGGEVHLVPVPPLLDGEGAAAGVEGDLLPAGLQLGEHHMGGCQGGVAAEVNLPGGGEPPQGIVVAGFRQEGSFGEVVLLGHPLHQGLRQGLEADGGGIPGEELVGEGVHNELRGEGAHGVPSSCPAFWNTWTRKETVVSRLGRAASRATPSLGVFQK